MPKKPSTERKIIVMKNVELELDQIFDNKTIREAQEALEKFRISLNEYEILYGATITMETGWDSVYAKITRPETDREYNDRMERNRIARERKATAEQRKKEQDALKAKKKAELQRKNDLKVLKRLANEYKLDIDSALERLLVDNVDG